MSYYHERSVENGLDPAHNEFMHPTHGFSGINRDTHSVRDFMLEPEHDGPIHARNKAIAKQDIDILNELYPNLTPVSNTKEVLMPADKAIAAYREWLSKFDDMGWRIDLEEFNRRNGKSTAFAIPCPARRTSGNWVIEEIPRIGSRAARKARKDEAA